MDKPLSPNTLAAIDLGGRPFLHEQGRFLGRGYVVNLEIGEDDWSLGVRDVEVFDPVHRTWSPEVDSDTYGGQIRSEYTFQQCSKTGLITLSGYAMAVYIAPPEKSWHSVDWPETDIYPGGPM